MTSTDRRWRPGFRLRVLGSFVALVAGASFLGLFLQRAVLLTRFDREVDAALDQEREELARLASGTDPRTGQPFGGDAQAIFDTFLGRNQPNDGEVFLTFVAGVPYASTPAPVRLDEDPGLMARWGSLAEGERGTIDTSAGPARYLAVPLATTGGTAGTFVVANFVRSERDEIAAIIRIEAVVTVGVLVVATAVAWFTAGRLLRPVRQLTETAEEINDPDLTRRIPVEGHDEIARLAARFNEMLDRLQRSFAVQRAFVDDAGHELRTPITIVRGHLEVMGDDPEDRRRTVALVTGELDRMARIVEDLLVLAKAEEADFLRLEPVEVADLTTELLVKARSLGDRGWTLDACAEGTARLDPQRVTQAVLNLARNALEHTPPDAEVALGSRWERDGLRIWVRDTGPGIAPEDQERLFERFARGSGAARRSEGAGLGLAIARSVAEAHGGRIELDSGVGRGSTFTVVLPGPPPPPTAAVAGADEIDPVDAADAADPTGPQDPTEVSS